MPAYNAEKTIKASVESVLNQTFTDFELIIIDDCSTDGANAICTVYAEQDKRIRIIKNEKNKGVAFSRNRGINEAQGEWIAFLDSDDLWMPEKLEKQLAFITETGADISYTSSAFIDADGRRMNYIMNAERELTHSMLLRKNLMSCSSVVVRREIMQEIKFEEGPIHEDYAVWLRIVRDTGAAYGLDEPLLVYRVSKSSRSGRRFKSGMMVYRTYRITGYGAIYSFFMTFRYAKHSLGKRIGMKRSIR
jgi:teichuronic acid biosynthesis glycosyltransferase TuaG